MRYDAEQARALARRAIGNAGASEAVARSLANATIAAEIHGRPGVGFAHLLDYLDGLRHGRIADNAQPLITFPVPAAIRVDACQGIAQLGFDQAFDALLHRAQTFGIAVFAQTNSYTAGELGYYTRRLAQAGLVALAATNGPALVAAGRARVPVYGTVFFAAPVEHGMPLVIDQATSATAYVNLRKAAEHGEPIPEGWAIDAAGQPTTDARGAGRLAACFRRQARRQHRLDGGSPGGGHDRRELVIGLSTVRPRQRLAGGGTVHCRDGAGALGAGFFGQAGGAAGALVEPGRVHAGQTAGIPRN